MWFWALVIGDLVKTNSVNSKHMVMKLLISETNKQIENKTIKAVNWWSMSNG